MKSINYFNGSIVTGLFLLLMSLFLNSCKKDEDPVIPESHAKAIWMSTGRPKPDTLISASTAGGSYGVNFQDSNNSLYLDMHDRDKEYYYLVIDPDFGNLVELRDAYYRFSMNQSKQSVKDFSLDPNSISMEKGTITIGIDTFNYKSMSGSMHVDKCEDQNGTYVLTYDSKGTFSGQFYDIKRPNIKKQISGSWDIDLF